MHKAACNWSLYSSICKVHESQNTLNIIRVEKFGLANRPWFAKFAKLSPVKLPHYMVNNKFVANCMRLCSYVYTYIALCPLKVCAYAEWINWWKVLFIIMWMEARYCQIQSNTHTHTHTHTQYTHAHTRVAMYMHIYKIRSYRHTCLL